VAITHLSAVPPPYWLRFGSRHGHTSTTVTARDNRRATRWNIHIQAYVYEHVHTK